MQRTGTLLIISLLSQPFKSDRLVSQRVPYVGLTLSYVLFLLAQKVNNQNVMFELVILASRGLLSKVALFFLNNYLAIVTNLKCQRNQLHVSAMRLIYEKRHKHRYVFKESMEFIVKSNATSKSYNILSACLIMRAFYTCRNYLSASRNNYPKWKKSLVDSKSHSGQRLTLGS